MTTAEDRICSIDGCDRPRQARGWCKMHWARWRHYGDTCRPAEIPARWQARFWSKVDKTGECWIWTPTTGRGGYGRFGHPTRGMVLAHRLAWELTRGGISEGSLLHSCDNPSCVNPEHLRVGTHEDNMRDMAERERSRTTKLTADYVSKIRALSRDGRSTRSLARQFGVTQGNVVFILAGKTWKHVS